MSTGKKILPPPRTPQGPSRHSPNAPRGPRVLQPKMAAPHARPTPTAPPVYRPQPVPKVLQRKSAAVTPPAGAARQMPAAPPVYRPQSPPKVLQRKAPGSAAPPVYRPQPVPKVLQRKSDQTPAAPRAAARPGATPGRPGAIQPKATPTPPAAYRPQPPPLCLRSNKPAAPSVAQRKILINGEDIDLHRNAQLKTHLESQLQQYGIVRTDAIYAALRANDSEFEYTSEDEVAAEIQVRRHITTGIALIEAHAGYDHDADTLNLVGDEWEVVPGIAGREEAPRHVFRPQNNASAAIRQLFETDDNVLECNSATVAVHYHALLEVMGATGFDEDLGDQVVVMPEFVNINEGREEEAPSRTLIPQVTLASPADLVPGDWVYFMNYPEYEEVNGLLEAKNKLPGAFEGENAVYVGGGRYKGFGVDECNFDQMVATLREEYNKLVKRYETEIPAAQRRKAFAKKTRREANAETLDGQVPGIEKTTVRRVMANAEVRMSAGSRLYDRKCAEIRAQVSGTAVAGLQAVWAALNAEFRDALKDAFVTRIITQLNGAAPPAMHQMWRSLGPDLRDGVRAKVLSNKPGHAKILRHIFPRQYHEQSPVLASMGPVGRSR